MNGYVNQDQVLSVLRSLLTVGGTWLVSHGVMTDTDWTTVAGAILAVAPIAWGWYAHSKKGKLAAAA